MTRLFWDIQYFLTIFMLEIPKLGTLAKNEDTDVMP